MDDKQREDAENNEMERVMKMLGLEIKKDALIGAGKFEYKFINPALATVTPDVKPNRDVTIDKNDIENLEIEMGLYETGKITFDEFLERV